MLNFTLMDFFGSYKINDSLKYLQMQHPEYFLYKQLHFEYQEGAFPFFYWSGYNFNNIQGSQLIQREQLTTNITNTPLLLNCENVLLQESDLVDCKTNVMLQLLENGSNALLVSSPLVIEYVKEKYPQYYLVGGHSLQYLDPEKKYLDDVKIVRKWTEDNSEYYNDIPKNKIDICIFSCCSHCDRRHDCFQEDCMNRALFLEHSTIHVCPTKQFSLKTPDEIKALNREGYTHFHFDMSGFILSDYMQVIEIYLRTFIKEEYYQIVRNALQEAYDG